MQDASTRTDAAPSWDDANHQADAGNNPHNGSDADNHADANDDSVPLGQVHATDHGCATPDHGSAGNADNPTQQWGERRLWRRCHKHHLTSDHREPSSGAGQNRLSHGESFGTSAWVGEQKAPAASS